MPKNECICYGTLEVVELEDCSWGLVAIDHETLSISLTETDEVELPKYEMIYEDPLPGEKLKATTIIQYNIEDIDPTTIKTPSCPECGNKTILKVLGFGRPHRPGVISHIFLKPHYTECDHWVADWNEETIYSCLCGKTAQWQKIKQPRQKL